MVRGDANDPAWKGTWILLTILTLKKTGTTILGHGQPQTILGFGRGHTTILRFNRPRAHVRWLSKQPSAPTCRVICVQANEIPVTRGNLWALLNFYYTWALGAFRVLMCDLCTEVRHHEKCPTRIRSALYSPLGIGALTLKSKLRQAYPPLKIYPAVLSRAPVAITPEDLRPAFESVRVELNCWSIQKPGVNSLSEVRWTQLKTHKRALIQVWLVCLCNVHNA